MPRFWLVFCLVGLYFQSSNAFILPLKTPDGTLNLEHLVGHMTLLEQTVTTLQQTVTSQNADISALKTEIANLKSTQQRADTKMVDLQKQIQTGQITAVLSLKEDIVNAKNAIKSVSSKAMSISSTLTNLTQNYQALSSQINTTNGARERELNVLDQKYKALFLQVNTTDVATGMELKTLEQKYQALTSQVNLTTKNEQALQAAVGRALSEVQSAMNDRLQLHGDVTRLNHTLSSLASRSNGTAMTVSSLSAKIGIVTAQLNTEVAFESWMGSSIVTVSNFDTIKFSNIQHNVGGAYNASTGLFTAPVAGRYLFWSQVEKVTGSRFYLWIKKESQDLGYFFSPASGYVTGIIIASTGVSAGENVYVVTSGAGSIQQDLRSRFGGVLLHRQ